MPLMELSFDHVEEITKQLTKTAEHLQDLSETCGVRSIQMITEAWVGANAEIYWKEERRVIEDIKNSACRLKKLSDVMDEKAKRIYGSEIQNVMTAKYRAY